MPSKIGSTRQSIKCKHRPPWQDQLRKDCLQRIHEQRDRLLQQCRSKPVEETLRSVLSDVSQLSLSKGRAENSLTEVHDNGEVSPAGAPSERARQHGKSLLGHQLLSVEEHQDLMTQMEAALFDESCREELEAIEAAEVQDISDMFATHCIVDHAPETEQVKVLCPICERTDLAESAFGAISCPIDHFCIDPPIQGLGASLKYTQDSLCLKLEEHRASGCFEKPHFFVKRIASENLYMACFECGACEIIV